MKKNIFIIYIVLIFFAGACSSTQKKNTHSALNYSESAKKLYNKGIISFERERWSDSEKIFMSVNKQYPYSKYAPLAELRIADCHFNLGSHAEAAVEYQHFIKIYPTHAQTHYAAFKKAQAYYEQIPSEWFLTPPAHEKDQTATRDARSAFASFLRNYPASEYVPEAEKQYTRVENALVQHEMYVAAFYLRREKRKAADVRLESIGRQFPDSPLVPDAMFLQGITLLEMGKEKDANKIFNLIIKIYPENPQADRSKKYLRALQSNLEKAR